MERKQLKRKFRGIAQDVNATKAVKAQTPAKPKAIKKETPPPPQPPTVEVGEGETEE